MLCSLLVSRAEGAVAVGGNTHVRLQGRGRFRRDFPRGQAEAQHQVSTVSTNTLPAVGPLATCSLGPSLGFPRSVCSHVGGGGGILGQKVLTAFVRQRLVTSSRLPCLVRWFRGRVRGCQPWRLFSSSPLQIYEFFDSAYFVQGSPSRCGLLEN